MRKKHYIQDILNPSQSPDGTTIEVIGWVKSKRRHGGVTFIDVTDSTGNIQAVANKKQLSADTYDTIASVPVESAVCITGIVKTHREQREVVMQSFEVIARDTLNLHPQPRMGFNIFDPKMADHIALCGNLKMV